MIGSINPRADVRRSVLATVGAIISRRSPAKSVTRKILVVRPDHLGDLLFLTPALRRLRQGLPDAEIVGLVGPWGLPVLGGNPNLDRILTWEFPWFDRRPRRSLIAPYSSLARLAMILHAERFDLAVQFRADFWWGALAASLAKIPDRIGYDTPVGRPFLTRAFPFRHGGHAARENFLLAQAIVGGGDRDEGLEFPVSEVARSRASALLSSIEAGRPIIGLQVGAGAPVKLWPLDRLASVGRAMRDEFGVAVIVVGGPGEIESVRQVADSVGADALPLAGQTTVAELAAVLERCKLVIGPDSGPLHLAVAVGTPTVHLYGPADARRFGPYGDPRWHVVIQSNRACAPCNRLDFSSAEVPIHPCVSAIESAEVTRVAADLLVRSLRRPRPL